MYVMKEKNCYSECYKKFCMQARFGPKHFDTLKPEPDPSPDRLTTLGVHVIS